MNKIKEKVLKELEKTLGYNCYVEEDCKKTINLTLAEVQKEIEDWLKIPCSHRKIGGETNCYNCIEELLNKIGSAEND